MVSFGKALIGRSPIFFVLCFSVLALVPKARAADTDVVINEIMYHPDTDCEREEFIELYNRSQTDPVDLSGWRFSNGVYYTFPSGTILAPDSYLVVCRDIDGFNDYYGTPTVTLLGPWGGKLSNNGEKIELVNASSVLIDEVRYNDKRPWPISPDGAGPSLELVNPNDENSSAGAWRAAVSNWYSTTWSYHEVTGIASSTTVYFYLDTEGECLIDDLELRATTNPTTNYIINGGFEQASPLGWTPTGNHGGSARITTDAHSGSACLKIVATGAGGAASGLVWQTCQPITLNGPQYTLSFWCKGLRPGVVLRVGMRGGTGGTWSPTNSDDIGSPSPAGGYSYDSGTDTYSVWGSGSDIWGTADHFHYIYTTMSGDGSLEATVTPIANPGHSSWAKGGIMIRESAAADSAYAYCLLSFPPESGPPNGVAFQYRLSTGGTADNSIPGPSTVGPVGLRLRREGDNFIAEADTGGGYSEIDSIPISMSPTVLIGFAVTSHNDGTLTTYTFAQPVSNVGSGFFTEVSVPNFMATPGAENSRHSTNTPPYIRNVDTLPDQPKSGQPIEVRAKITDPDGITSAVLAYQIVLPGHYIRLGDPEYQTSWTLVAMSPATTPSYWAATIPAQAHRTLVRYRISAQDATGRVTTVPYSDDSEPNYARYVYDGVPPYYASPHPGVQPYRWHTNLTKVPVLQLIADAGDVHEAEAVSIYDKVERRQFKWRGTVVFNGKVYDHIRFRMRGGCWRYKYNKRMWKIRFNRGHYLDFIHNDGTPYSEELRTLNMLACIQPPGNVPSWVKDKYGDNSQRGEEGIIDRLGYWLWQQVGAIAPDCTWVHFRIVDEPSEDGSTYPDGTPRPLAERQYWGDFYGLYLALQGMDKRMLRTNGRPVGNLYKIDSYGQIPGQPPWFQDAKDCALPEDDIIEFRREYGPKAGYPTPTKEWWEQNFELDSYYSARAIIDCIHHGDLYNTTSWDGVGSGKNYYYYHNPETNKWEFIAWDIDLTLGTDHGDGSEPFRDRIIRNSAIPEFGIAYKNRLREVIQLLFNEEKLFPTLDEWRDLLYEIAEADRDRWDYAPATGPEDFDWQGHFKTLDVRLADIKYWIRQRVNYLTNPPTRNWWLERGATWPRITCWDPDIPATPTLTAPPAGTFFSATDPIVLTGSTYSDPNGNPHAASKWIATRVGGNELMPDWSSGIASSSLTSATIPPGTLAPGDYWLRVRYENSTGRWSWWSEAVQITVTGGPSAVRNWREY